MYQLPSWGSHRSWWQILLWVCNIIIIIIVILLIHHINWKALKILRITQNTQNHKLNASFLQNKKPANKQNILTPTCRVLRRMRKWFCLPRPTTVRRRPKPDNVHIHLLINSSDKCLQDRHKIINEKLTSAFSDTQNLCKDCFVKKTEKIIEIKNFVKMLTLIFGRNGGSRVKLPSGFPDP